jgi:N6-L-threonylcarbamoyladenine synthase
VDVLARKTISAAKETGVDRILVSGGVAANSRLREELIKKGEENNIRIYIPSLYLCMDNAAMVGCLGYFKYQRGLVDDLEVDVSSRSDF